VALAALLMGGGFLSVAPNRLLPGAPLAAAAVLPIWAWLAVPLLMAAALPGRLAAPAAAFALLLLLAGTGVAASALLEGRPPAARAMLGGAFWSAAAAAAVLALWPRAARRGVAAVLLAGGGAALLATGTLDALSLVVEYRARAEAVWRALGEHLWLSLAALVLAFLLATPLALASMASRRLASAADGALAAVQVVPALALFGLLVPLLSLLLTALPALRAAGLGAIGATPALIAIALYLALPLFRALRTALGETDPAALEAARALGLGPWRMLAWVRLPLGAPHLLAGLRVAAVQAIGLVTLGGLIGAGGLGALVFEGMAQFATDLILLGALPVVLLALAADAALGRP
jgi:osmoprotectant transport system permease protein